MPVQFWKERASNAMKKKINYPLVIILTILTFGLYGAFWALNSSYEEPDESMSEEEKNASDMQRAAGMAFLMRGHNRL